MKFGVKPQPFREVKRRLESAGFVEAGQKGSHVKFVRARGQGVDTAIMPRQSEHPPSGRGVMCLLCQPRHRSLIRRPM